MSERVRSPELAWGVIGATLGAVALWAAYRNIGTLLLAVFIYYATRPVLRRVRRVVPSPSLAVFISLGTFVLPALCVIGYTLLVAVHELYNVVAIYGSGNLQPYIEPYVSDSVVGLDWHLLFTAPMDFFATTSGVSLARSLFEYVISSVSILGAFFVDLALVLILVFYFLRDDQRISRWIHTHLGVYLPQWDVYAREVDTDLSTIFFGNILHALITGLIGVTTYTVISIFNPSPVPVPYPALLGMLCGIASLIPLVGTKLVYVPVGLYMTVWSYSLGGDTPEFGVSFAFIGASYVIIDTIPDVVIRPYVSSKRIHMGLVMLAYIVGPALFGWYGFFLGPVCLVLGVHFTAHILPHLLEPRTGGRSEDSETLTDRFLSGQRVLTDYTVESRVPERSDD